MVSSDWILQIDALFRRVQQQEPLAMQLLYAETAPKVYAILMRILKSTSEAEDALQEAYIKVWSHANQFSGSGSAWGWLCVMARHVALDRLRQMKRTTTDAIDHVEEIASQIDESNQLQDRHWLGKCLDTLKPHAKQAVLLSYVEGYSHAEISARVDKPLGTVKAWIRRGLEELKQCLVH